MTTSPFIPSGVQTTTSWSWRVWASCAFIRTIDKVRAILLFFSRPGSKPFVLIGGITVLWTGQVQRA